MKVGNQVPLGGADCKRFCDEPLEADVGPFHVVVDPSLFHDPACRKPAADICSTVGAPVIGAGYSKPIQPTRAKQNSYLAMRKHLESGNTIQIGYCKPGETALGLELNQSA